MNKIRLQWQHVIFYAEIPPALLELYLSSIGVADKKSQKFYLYLAIFNLTRIVSLELSQIFPGCKVGSIEAHDSDQLFDTHKLTLDLASEVLGKFTLVLSGDDLTSLEQAYYAKNLNLEKHSATNKTFTTSFEKYTLQVYPPKLIHNSNKLLCCTISHKDNLENVYFSVSFAEYLYQKSYPKFIPFKCSSFHLQIVANIINLWLRTQIKQYNTTISAIKLAKIPVMYYNPGLVSSEDFADNMYFREDSAIIKELRLASQSHAQQPNDENALLDLDQQAVSLPVVKCFFEFSLEQLQQIKTGDILLLTENEISNNLFLGTDHIYAKCNETGENKLSIIAG